MPTTSKNQKTPPIDISNILAKKADAYLIHGDLHNTDLFYAARFLMSDPFSYILTASGEEMLLIPDMEKGRAQKESRVSDKNIKTTSDYNYRSLVKEKKDTSLAYALVLKAALAEKNIKTVAVDYDFPAYYFDALQKEGLKVVLMKNVFDKSRAIKTKDEISKIAESQEAAEKAMAAAILMIQNSTVEKETKRLLHNGFVLTGEMVLKEIARILTENNCLDEETIVSCGEDSADPHGKTYGDLYAQKPIVIDIFPKNKQTRYFGDMTRTVIKGKATPKLIKMYDAVKTAQAIGVSKAKAGVTCSDVHNVVCDSLEKSGFDTYRSGSKVGFIHTTGHGVGLDIHETPSVSDNPHVLEVGNVITIEPGLYYPGIGGIRIEDTVVITKDGCLNLNKMEKVFEI
ncbi:MAG: Xaa-Pro peptidase family protein [Methanimicrococcus sp.]|nr:Xaa-Pro peptidase family protein [Methanimicrococcus sp.]